MNESFFFKKKKWQRIETYKRVRPLMLDKDSGKGPERLLLFSRLTIAKATTNKKQTVRSNTQQTHASISVLRETAAIRSS